MNESSRRDLLRDALAAGGVLLLGPVVGRHLLAPASAAEVGELNFYVQIKGMPVKDAHVVAIDLGHMRLRFEGGAATGIQEKPTGTTTREYGEVKLALKRTEGNKKLVAWLGDAAAPPLTLGIGVLQDHVEILNVTSRGFRPTEVKLAEERVMATLSVEEVHFGAASGAGECGTQTTPKLRVEVDGVLAPADEVHQGDEPGTLKIGSFLTPDCKLWTDLYSRTAEDPQAVRPTVVITDRRGDEPVKTTYEDCLLVGFDFPTLVRPGGPKPSWAGKMGWCVAHLHASSVKDG